MTSLHYSNLSLFTYTRMSGHKRLRNPLRQTAHQRQYEAISQTGYYAGTQRSVMSDSNIKKKRKIMKDRSELSRELIYSPPPKMGSLIRGPMSPEIERKRRESIHYQFEYIYGSPSENEWKETGVVLGIMRTLLIPDNSRTSVERY